MTAIERLYQLQAEIYKLKCVCRIIEWDQQVNLPSLGAEERAEQIELLSTLIHQRETAPEFIALLSDLAERDDLAPEDRVNVRELWRDVKKAQKLPESFVAEKARLAARCYHEWTEARPANDFARVAPLLSRLVELARQQADLLGYSENPYDALFDSYEPYGLLSHVKPLLMDLGEQLSALVPRIIEKQEPLRTHRRLFPKSQQQAFCSEVVAAIGYNFNSGRLDTAPHPFEASLGANDIRITTRYSDTNYLSGLFTALHEAGHALYEDGLQKRWRGTPMGSAISLGIHESQSRLWENIVGRSLPFARYIHSVLRDHFPEEHAATTPEQIWAHTNFVERSMIRVEADEVTYSLHIVIRMLLEVALINGELTVEDLPAAWNEYYQRYLGVTPDSDRNGVLQDVHWYSGNIGYFPTYALGNLYGAMMHEQLLEDLPHLNSLIECGEFGPLTQWLRTNVHLHGMSFTGPALIEHITHRPLSTEPFVRYIRNKFGLAEKS
jgi:carboxypeptidase Taq